MIQVLNCVHCSCNLDEGQTLVSDFFPFDFGWVTKNAPNHFKNNLHERFELVRGQCYRKIDRKPVQISSNVCGDWPLSSDKINAWIKEDSAERMKWLRYHRHKCRRIVLVHGFLTHVVGRCDAAKFSRSIPATHGSDRTWFNTWNQMQYFGAKYSEMRICYRSSSV